MNSIGRAFTCVPASLLLTIATLPTASAQATAPTTAAPSDFASDAAVRTQIRTMLAEMKPDQGFQWRPLVRDGATVAAIEIWKKPGRPAVHPAEAEYAIVLEGAGTLVSG
ncbi:MAG TPA: hypothetical protein VN029_04650, partial [Sphingomonas sp.]|nr:hypothetical protein [Sphingomonas sp.]